MDFDQPPGCDDAGEPPSGSPVAGCVGREKLLLLIGRDAKLPAACRSLCALLDYELLSIADAGTLVETLRCRRPAAVACGQQLVGLTSWFVLARLAQAGCDCDVLVEAVGIDADLRAAFDSCGALLGLTRVIALPRRLMVDDVARLLAGVRLHGRHPGLIELRH